MPLIPISAARAQLLVKQGAILVDIREPSEFAAQAIPGSRNLPLSCLSNTKLDVQGAKVIFLCRSGARTAANDRALFDLGGPGAQVLQNGLMAWAAAGFQTESIAPPRKGFFGLFG
ncbi:MAG: rhodanese-like domain-containing protein [Aestuariivirga sp.]